MKNTNKASYGRKECENKWLKQLIITNNIESFPSVLSLANYREITRHVGDKNAQKKCEKKCIG